MRCARRAAFTLVELSIVLVILGLLVGGVLAGQSLIHAAELRAVTTEFTNYKTSLGAFREKYNGLPGDMTNAIRFWGKLAGADTDGVDAACTAIITAGTVPTGTETCNGNGDGLIYSFVSMTEPFENFSAWKQLSNAGLVEGNYTGVSHTAGNDAMPGTNVPKSKFSNGAWSFQGFANTNNGGSMFTTNYGNTLFFGARLATNLPYEYAMKAEDAYTLDMKIDDGKPQSGTILTYPNSGGPDCVVATDDDYNVSSAVVGCILIFKTGY